MDLQKLAHSLHTLERKILPFLHDHATLSEISLKSKLNENEVMHAFKWLQNKTLIKITYSTKDLIILDKNARNSIEHGLPERKLINTLATRDLSLSQARKIFEKYHDDINLAIGHLKQKNLITIEKSGKDVIIKLTNDAKKYVSEKLPEELMLLKLSEKVHSLSDIASFDQNLFDKLRKRKRFITIKKSKIKSITLTDLCKDLLKQRLEINLLESLTPEIIKSKEWKNTLFRRYNTDASVPRLYFGRKHFVNEAISQVRKIWLEMGFKEMHGNIIQPSFWNFDALFVPQDHPARELQDTLFLKGEGSMPSKELVHRVKMVHESGSGANSKGWNYAWNESKARELVLRTHTTAISAIKLASLNKEQLPCRYFSVGKCFRNETVDWKHGFEFTQVEGIVVDKNANFQTLLGYLKTYYSKLGFDKIRFRPSYFPYTECSLEVEVYNNERNEWVEFGGAGIFRPEVVIPLFGEDIPVLAWGQGIERSIMDYYDIKDFRDLYKNDIKILREIKPWLK